MIVLSFSGYDVDSYDTLESALSSAHWRDRSDDGQPPIHRIEIFDTDNGVTTLVLTERDIYARNKPRRDAEELARKNTDPPNCLVEIADCDGKWGRYDSHRSLADANKSAAELRKQLPPGRVRIMPLDQGRIIAGAEPIG